MPAVAVPVTLNIPAVVKLPPVTLPVALSVVANTPVVPKLAKLALPDALSVPAMFAPVAVTTITLAVPATVIAMLPLAEIAILELPDA